MGDNIGGETGGDVAPPFDGTGNGSCRPAGTMGVIPIPLLVDEDFGIGNCEAAVLVAELPDELLRLGISMLGILGMPGT
jgi:hypothetical protein